MFRLFPSFEKPVERPRYLNIQPETHEFRGIGTVLLLAASCGVALALWEPSHQVTSPFVTASVSRSAPATATKVASQETTASVEAEDDQSAPTVGLSTACSQRATARRECASAKAFREARLKAAEPAAETAKEAQPQIIATKSASGGTRSASVAAKPASVATKPASVANKPEVVAVTNPNTHQADVAVAMRPETTAAAQPEPPVAQPPVAQPQRTASAPKVKRQRPPASSSEDGPVERLVRVYDQVLPDGRRVPVYRRAGSGGYETGTIVDGEYRPTRRANLDPPSGRFFGLQ